MPLSQAEGCMSNLCLPVGQGPSFRAMGLWHASSRWGLLSAVQVRCIFIQQVHCTSASQLGAEITHKPVMLPASPPCSLIIAVPTSLLSLLTASLGPLAAVLRAFLQELAIQLCISKCQHARLDSYLFNSLVFWPHVFSNVMRTHWNL